MIRVKVTEHPLEVASALNACGDSSHGAQTLFVGNVRDHNLGKQVQAVSYDAFAVLAEKVFQEICEEAQECWGRELSIELTHRTGRLSVGEASVIIAVGSPHRDEAYQASRYVIEQLKLRAPIWKKEHYVDGDSEWVQGHALCSRREVDRSSSCGRALHSHGAEQG